MSEEKERGEYGDRDYFIPFVSSLDAKDGIVLKNSLDAKDASLVSEVHSELSPFVMMSMVERTSKLKKFVRAEAIAIVVEELDVPITHVKASLQNANELPFLKWIPVGCRWVNMDTHYSPGGSNSLDDDQLNEDMGDDATNIPGSSGTTSSKKRGPSIGIEEIEGQPRPKLVMQTNRKGQPVTPIDVVSEFGTRLEYIARRDFPVCYEDWRHIGKDLKDKVVKTLGCQFVFEYEKMIDTDYTRQKLNEAWRNYKHTLYETFVEDEDPSLAMSARNKLNCKQQIMPSSLGRTSVVIARNELALEKGIPKSKITRANSYMLIHKPKETVPQSQEVLNSIKNHISEHPESQYDLSGDAIATVVGPDKRGRFRGLGIGVCKTVLRKGDSLMKKNDGLMEANTLLERRIETMEANMDAKMSRHMEEVRGLFMNQRGTFNDNVPSPHSHASHHSTAPAPTDKETNRY
ncbi:hypothetical protein IFM89_003432 [Coptis chinensis]|uniref:Transposase n=1 Tax=Coptis chinensis TaxID=261450 RepID=A0A835GWZ3_9MAGN|nr:hypothetical protein IFM89_003432 [Coptis chinensis]